MNVRDAYFYELYEQVKKGEDVSIVSCDLGAPSLDDFRRDFPDRFISVGIAEQNAVSVAGGLSLVGKKVVAYGLNPFPVTRAFDQIRNLMSSLRIPITVAALKAGTATAEAGISHMALENISLLRTLRNIRIISPSDETISRCLVEDTIHNPAPRYVQFDPFISGELYDKDELFFDKGFVVSGGEVSTVVVASGIWAHILKKEKLPAKLIDCFVLPVDEDSLCNELKGCHKIITIEDGIAVGGIGSMLLEILNDHSMQIPVKRMALRFLNGYPDVFSDRERIFKDEGLLIDVLQKELSEG